MWQLSSQIAPEALALQAGALLPTKLPVELEEIIRVMAIEVTPFDLPDSISGIYNEIGGQPYIAVNSRHSAARRRFTVAHELYHFLTKHHEDIALAAATAAGMEEIEKNANRFAALLLMPEDAVRAIRAKGICLRHMAEVFDVSEQAMQIRLRDLGLKPMSHRESGSGHYRGDCCELAHIQRVARQPYIEQSLSSMAGAWMLREEGQLSLPMSFAGDQFYRTVEGVDEDGSYTKRT